MLLASNSRRILDAKHHANIWKQRKLSLKLGLYTGPQLYVFMRCMYACNVCMYVCVYVMHVCVYAWLSVCLSVCVYVCDACMFATNPSCQPVVLGPGGGGGGSWRSADAVAPPPPHGGLVYGAENVSHAQLLRRSSCGFQNNLANFDNNTNAREQQVISLQTTLRKMLLTRPGARYLPHSSGEWLVSSDFNNILMGGAL